MMCSAEILCIISKAKEAKIIQINGKEDKEIGDIKKEIKQLRVKRLGNLESWTRFSNI